MFRLSIVISCVREPGCFEATLASVLQNRPTDSEVLVVQPRPYNDPYGLGEEVRFIQAPSDSTLIDLINVGITAATGGIVHLLSCDMEVSEGWVEPALRHFEDPAVGSISPLITMKSQRDRIVARGVYYGTGGVRNVAGRPGRGVKQTACDAPDAPTLSAGLYRRNAVLRVGGFCPAVGPIFADIDLGLMLQAAGYCCIHEKNSIVTTERQCQAPALSFAHGRAAERLFWRNTEPSDWMQTRLIHPGTWLMEGLANLYRPRILLQLLGRACGWAERSSRRQHRRRIQAWKTDRSGDQPREPGSSSASQPPAHSELPSPFNRRAAA